MSMLMYVSIDCCPCHCCFDLSLYVSSAGRDPLMDWILVVRIDPLLGGQPHILPVLQEDCCDLDVCQFLLLFVVIIIVVDSCMYLILV